MLTDPRLVEAESVEVLHEFEIALHRQRRVGARAVKRCDEIPKPELGHVRSLSSRSCPDPNPVRALGLPELALPTHGSHRNRRPVLNRAAASSTAAAGAAGDAAAATRSAAAAADTGDAAAAAARSPAATRAPGMLPPPPLGPPPPVAPPGARRRSPCASDPWRRCRRHGRRRAGGVVVVVVVVLSARPAFAGTAAADGKHDDRRAEEHCHAVRSRLHPAIPTLAHARRDTRAEWARNALTRMGFSRDGTAARGSAERSSPPCTRDRHRWGAHRRGRSTRAGRRTSPR